MRAVLLLCLSLMASVVFANDAVSTNAVLGGRLQMSAPTDGTAPMCWADNTMTCSGFGISCGDGWQPNGNCCSGWEWASSSWEFGYASCQTP